MLILWLFPVVFLGVCVAWAARVGKAGSTRSAPPRLSVTLVAFCLCCALAFLILCADPLAAIEAARREATETVGLARTVKLPFDDEEDGQVAISLARVESGRSPLLTPNLVLFMRPDPDHPWHIAPTHSERGRFSELDGKITQNDPGIDGLGKGNFARFPVRIRSIKDEDGLAFDLGAADIRAGRKREAAKRIAAWLGG